MTSSRFIATLGLGLIPLNFALAARADDKPILTDDFSDGNYTAAPAWVPRKGTWQVKDGALSLTGDAEFSAIATTDFNPIEDGAFRLSFDVKFRGEESSGRNRFIVAMRDKSGKGYQAEISQGTSNNTIISRLDPASTTLSQGLLSPAFKFPVGAFTRVVFSRTAAGVLTVTVNGQEYLKATDAMHNQFTSVQLNSRSPDATLIQEFDNIRLDSPTATAALPDQPRNVFYRPADYRWVLQQIDFAQPTQKPSTGFGPVVAKGSDSTQLALDSLLKAGWNTAQFRVQRGFQGPAVASWQAARGATTAELPALPRGAYWLTAKTFDAQNRLGEHKVFF